MAIKTISISAKCSDLCFTTVIDANGDTIKESDGYVPDNIGIGGGDYVDLDIDIETGTIVNWKRPTDKAIINAMEKC